MPSPFTHPAPDGDIRAEVPDTRASKTVAKREVIIGTIGFSSIVFGAFQSCYLGYRLDRGELNKGLATEALRATIRFVFTEFRLHRIEANVMPRNVASKKVLENLGFQNEGISRS
jgi:ribosomal-protein-alanine N-acetyltransferase